jgi:hypothetical protein
MASTCYRAWSSAIRRLERLLVLVLRLVSGVLLLQELPWSLRLASRVVLAPRRQPEEGCWRVRARQMAPVLLPL